MICNREHRENILNNFTDDSEVEGNKIKKLKKNKLLMYQM